MSSLNALGHPELIATACERASWASRLSGDPVMPAVADWMRAWDMWATADRADSGSRLPVDDRHSLTFSTGNVGRPG